MGVAKRPLRREGGRKLTWLGGVVREVGGEFSWLDGSDWDFTHWDEEAGEPSRKVGEGKTTHECVYMGFDVSTPGKLGLWSDGVCNTTKPYVLFDCICKL